MRRCFQATLLLLLIGTLPSHAQGQGAVSKEWPTFVQALDDFALTDSVVGASAVLLKDGRVIAHHERGQADRELHQPVDAPTIFHWASITKTLTAIAIMQLRDRKLLTLDDRITDYIPELRQVHNRFGSMDAITIRMLLSHTSGFQDPTWPYTEGKAWEPFEPTRWEQLVSMMPYQEIEFRPGSRFGYSNPAFIYLARIIEQLTGDPYEVYIQKNLWMPLGLTHSYFGVTPYHLGRWRSNNYTLTRDSTGTERVVANGRDFDPGITIPNGGWNAPLGDLVRYVSFLTNAPAGDSATGGLFSQVLERSSLEEMWQPVIQLSGNGLGSAVGLSFFLSPGGLVEHDGYQAGFRSHLMFNRSTREAIIFVVNTDNQARAEESDQRWVALINRARSALRR